MSYSSKEVSVEVLFAQRLASNEPKIRDRHVKKLSKFLEAKSAAAAAGKPGLQEEELLKLWKGLHYCFWMSDKPLVQEELAERISAMVHVFRAAGDDHKGFLPFVRCGLVTLGREWFGIDRWRMDKFMMFVRRFLRQVLAYSKNKDWENSEALAQAFLEAVYPSCHSPAKPPSRKSAPSSSSQSGPSSLGFQLHFADVFLEELAKVIGQEEEEEEEDDSLPLDETIRSFLRPFTAVLREARDARLRGHVEERVFHHLMRQSDVGIAYDEGDDGEEEEAAIEEEGGDDEKEEEAAEMQSDSDDEEEGEMEEENEGESGPSAQDPRAGRVDVTIPQLMLDYEKLAEDLLAAGGEKTVGQVQRKILYKLSRQFRQLHEGRYPLAAELSDEEEGEEDAPKVSAKKLRKKRAREEEEALEANREARKEYKAAMAAKRKRDLSAPEEEQEEEEEEDEEEEEEGKKESDSGMEDDDASEEEGGGEERLTEAGEEEELPARKATKGGGGKNTKVKAKKNTKDGGAGSKSPGDSAGDVVQEPKKKGKKKKKKNPSLHGEAAGDSSSEVAPKEEIKKSAQDHHHTPTAILSTPPHGDEEEAATGEEGTPKVSKKKRKRESDVGTEVGKDEEGEGVSKKKKKKLKLDKGSRRRSGEETTASSPEGTPAINATATAKSPKQALLRQKEEEDEELPKSKSLPGGEGPPKIRSLKGKQAPTPVFFKKAASKAAAKSPQSSSQAGGGVTPKNSPSPAKKKTKKTPATGGKGSRRISFVANKYQSVLDHSLSIQESPDIPFVPERQPKHGLLKNKDDISVVHTPSPLGGLGLKAVQKNTKINGKVTPGSKVIRRMVASDFF